MHMMIVIAAMAVLVVTPFLDAPAMGERYDAPSENVTLLDDEPDQTDSD